MEAKQQLNILEQRKLERLQSIKKLKIIAGIGICFLILLIIIFVSALQQGGISNLIKGDKDAVSNTLTNIGTTLTGGPDASPTPDYSKPIQLPAPRNSTTNPNTKVEYIYLGFINDNISFTVKKNIPVIFANSTDAVVVLEFSDRRKLSLRPDETSEMVFNTKGNISFQDTFDNSNFKIKGVITVVD